MNFCQAFKSYNTDSPTVSVRVENCSSLNIKQRAFASIKSLSVLNIQDLTLESLALKLKIPTLEPTIHIWFSNISTTGLASSTFSSSFKNILIENSRVDKIHTNAFSGKITAIFCAVFSPCVPKVYNDVEFQIKMLSLNLF